MRILVCGDRNWINYEKILDVLSCYEKDDIVIHGVASGADSIAGTIAKTLGMTVLEFPADWKQYGRSAGPIRNRQMLKEGKPDIVLAFHNNINKSKGTKDMINAAKKSGIEVKLYSTN